jgi:hypothetical protein
MPLRAILTPNLGSVLYLATLLGAAHVMAGVCILQAPSAGQVSAYNELREIVAPPALAWLLIMVGAAAVVAGGVAFDTRLRLAMLVPQELVLVLIAISIGSAVVEGKYPDGYLPIGGSWFILADHNIAWIVCIMHGVEFASLAARLRGG